MHVIDINRKNTLTISAPTAEVVYNPQVVVAGAGLLHWFLSLVVTLSTVVVLATMLPSGEFVKLIVAAHPGDGYTIALTAVDRYPSCTVRTPHRESRPLNNYGIKFDDGSDGCHIRRRLLALSPPLPSLAGPPSSYILAGMERAFGPCVARPSNYPRLGVVFVVVIWWVVSKWGRFRLSRNCFNFV